MLKHISPVESPFFSNQFVEILRCDHDVYRSMAYDEFIFQESIKKNINYLRFYKITSPSVTIGYSTKKNSGEIKNLPWTRRITGGGIVNHGEDIIITLAFSSSDSIPANIYHFLHKSIKRFLSKILPGIQIAGKTEKNGELCFQNPVQSDLIYNDVKITGGALKRKGKYYLYQGSIQLKKYESDIFISLQNMKSELNIKITSYSEINKIINKVTENNLVGKYRSEFWKMLR